MTQNIRAWIKLSQTPELKLTKVKKLIDILGEPVEFIGKGTRIFDDMAFLTDIQKGSLASAKDPENYDEICRLLEKHNISFAAFTDPQYPERLKEIYDPPMFLFYRGKLSLPQDERALAVVGTRKPDNYGMMMTKKITEELVEAGFTIVSGLAYGIDTIAHNITTANDGRTIAVMGTGCETIYPTRNCKLAEKILEQGALVSEHIPGTKTEKWFFSGRNRIISGLSLGTLITQGAKTSGALITARFALDQNRDLFALPGDINRVQSAGPNHLIKMGAKIVTCTEDILEEYDLYIFSEEKKQVQLTGTEEKVITVIRDNRPEINYDNIVIKTGMHFSELSPILLSLEMKNLIYIGSGNMVSAKD